MIVCLCQALDLDFLATGDREGTSSEHGFLAFQPCNVCSHQAALQPHESLSLCSSGLQTCCIPDLFSGMLCWQ